MAGFGANGGTIHTYPTPESLENKINEYFELCFAVEYNHKLKRHIIKEVQTPTFAGMARYLGFSTRQQLLNYKNETNPLYEEVLSNARLRLEEYLEQRLINCKGNPSGLMFALKNNAQWEETSRQQITGADDRPLVFTWANDSHDVMSDPTINRQLNAGVPRLEAGAYDDAETVESD